MEVCDLKQRMSSRKWMWGDGNKGDCLDKTFSGCEVFSPSFLGLRVWRLRLSSSFKSLWGLFFWSNLEKRVDLECRKECGGWRKLCFWLGVEKILYLLICVEWERGRMKRILMKLSLYYLLPVVEDSDR